MFTSSPTSAPVRLPALLLLHCQDDYFIMKRRHEKSDREAKVRALLPFRNAFHGFSKGCCFWWRCWCSFFAFCLIHSHRPHEGRPRNAGPVPFWSLMALSFCCLFFASGQSSSFLSFSAFPFSASTTFNSATSRDCPFAPSASPSASSLVVASGTNGNCNSVFAFISVPLLIYI